MADYTNTRRRFTAFTGQTSSANSAAFDWPGGDGFFVVYGGFGGGTATLKWSPDGGTTWVVLDSTLALTAAGAIDFNLPAGKIRVELTGATSATLTALVRALTK